MTISYKTDRNQNHSKDDLIAAVVGEPAGAGFAYPAVDGKIESWRTLEFTPRRLTDTQRKTLGEMHDLTIRDEQPSVEAK